MNELIKKFYGKETFQIEKLKDDISIRKYYRIIDDQSYVVAYCEDEEVHQKFINTQSVYDSVGILTPKILKNESKFLLLEDLGDLNLRRFLSTRTQEEIVGTYLKIINDLVKLHQYKNENNLKLKNYDLTWMNREIELTNKFYLDKILGQEKFSEQISKTFNIFLEKLNSFKKCINHRDLQSKNIVIKEEKIYWIDFQDSFYATPLYDLASLLEDPYFRLTQKAKVELKNTYFDSCEGLTNRTEFELLYSIVAIQRLYKAIGNYAKVFVEDKNPKYTVFIATAFDNMRNLITCNKELREFNILLELFYEH
jgi:aminoglycoside/choline kinase family phosphotransferase